MSNTLLVPDDLAPFAEIAVEKALAMIEDATATAFRVAPCLKDSVDADVLASAKAILRGAILRWNDAGTGQLTQQTAGPFAQSYVQTERKSMYWPTEIQDLQNLCTGNASARAFEIDTIPE